MMVLIGVILSVCWYVIFDLLIVVFLEEFYPSCTQDLTSSSWCILGHCSSGAWCDKSDLQSVDLVRVFNARGLTFCWGKFAYPVCEI